MEEEIRSEKPIEAGTSQATESEQVSEIKVSKEAKNMAVLCHILGLVGFVGPLVVWLITRDKDKFIDDTGREVINYQISLMIYFFAAWLSCIIFIGVLLLPALIVTHVIFVIMGTVKAVDGKVFHYPIAINFLK